MFQKWPSTEVAQLIWSVEIQGRQGAGQFSRVYKETERKTGLPKLLSDLEIILHKWFLSDRLPELLKLIWSVEK